jgi:dissimilatory sulfite reductase related protein
MAAKTINGKTYEVNEEGFLVNGADWNKEFAEGVAKEEGIEHMGDVHWKIIEFARKSAATSGGASPTLRTITDGAGVTTKELFSLFPKGPAKKVAKIAGLKKPEGCV